MPASLPSTASRAARRGRKQAVSLTPDVLTVALLGAGVMLTATFLPWVLLRPNRLAAGEYQHLSALWRGLGGGLALLLPLTLRWQPRLGALVAPLALVGGVWLLGHLTAEATQGTAGGLSRASASSGFWLWLLGSGLAMYAARLTVQNHALTRLLLWWWLPAAAALALTGQLQHWSLLTELAAQHSRFIQELAQHLRLVLWALGLALGLGAPLAVWASRRERVAAGLLALVGGVQTVPSLALLGLLIAPLSALATALPALKRWGISGIGTAPALVAMTLYALLPIVQNGLAALRGVPAATLDAATGMGMTQSQRFWRVQLPLALPVWLSGVRQAAVLLVGVASVAQLIGAGGLGYFIFSGLQSGAGDLILLGALPAALLALLLDSALRGLEAGLGRLWLGSPAQTAAEEANEGRTHD